MSILLEAKVSDESVLVKVECLEGGGFALVPVDDPEATFDLRAVNSEKYQMLARAAAAHELVRVDYDEHGQFVFAPGNGDTAV